MSMLVEMGSVVENNILSDDVRAMVIQAPQVAAQAEPGQFVMVKNESGSTFLRRPFGVADVDREQGRLLLIYRVAGKGTRELAGLEPTMEISVEGPLGGGFRFGEASGGAYSGKEDGRTLLIGGGVGVAPLLYFGKKIREAGARPTFLLGARTQADLLQLELFEELGDVHVTTEDGSYGEKGFVTNHSVLERVRFDQISCCGPKPMMMAVARYAAKNDIFCEVSLENMMACGLGACLGCTCRTKVGAKTVCKDGPVFKAEEVFD